MPDRRNLNILRIDASARRTQSVSRSLGDELVRRLMQESPGARLTRRDLADPVPLVDADWVRANLADPDQRDARQIAKLSVSDWLVKELDLADVVVLTTPVYNFSVPAALKAWIDMICRARMTFRYTEQGPEGLLRDRPVYLVMASGGMRFGSPADFASGYLRQIFAFIGIHDVRLVQAEATRSGVQASEQAAREMIDKWLPGEPAFAGASAQELRP
jgi:FMN-dependent NADH-azoreductase